MYFEGPLKIRRFSKRKFENDGSFLGFFKRNLGFSGYFWIFLIFCGFLKIFVKLFSQIIQDFFSGLHAPYF